MISEVLKENWNFKKQNDKNVKNFNQINRLIFNHYDEVKYLKSFQDIIMSFFFN
jgi:hypothetical protein